MDSALYQEKVGLLRKSLLIKPARFFS